MKARFLTLSATTLAAALSLALAPAALAQEPDLGSEQDRAEGERLYAQYCSQCHGDDGAGEGIATPFLRPAPRDFTSAKYRVRSTPVGYLPTDEDLHRSIRDGLPGTGMPGFASDLSDEQITQVMYHLKSLAPDFEDPSAYGEVVPIPEPPPFDPESIETGFAAYVEVGCARCHGEEGRGDGMSAPTLRDDWGYFIPPADLTMPWYFRGGGTREDIYRSISTGLYGTPMAGFANLTEEQRWQIVDWIVAQARATTGVEDTSRAPYGALVRAVPHLEGLEGLSATEDGGEPGLAAARELFADAPKTLFPVVGQVVQPGRAFRPGTYAIGVQAIYDATDIAFLVTWHNITAETEGSNAPDLTVPPGEELVHFKNLELAGEEDEEPAETAAPADPFAVDPFATDTGVAAVGPPPGAGAFSDAIALQLPIELRDGVEKPYFLFGDPSYPVDLWFVDLANPEVQVYEGRGATALSPVSGRGPEVLAGFDKGEWAVIFKQRRTPARGVTFEEETFVPIAFSVWDGFYRERGSKRGLTRWFYVYVEPAEEPSVIAPMAKTGLAVLGIELLIIGLVRRKYRKKDA
jgi:mono/diheme cytochrome c family protein